MKKLLIVVDYQNDFVDGSLGFDGAEKLETVIYDKIKNTLLNNNDVIFTLDTHVKNYFNTQEGKRLPVAHCIFNTYGWKMYGKLKEFSPEKYPSRIKALLKCSFGCYNLFEELSHRDKYDEIELCGVVTSICVISNAIIAKTAQPEARIVINRNAVADFDKDAEESAFRVMETLQMDII